jgi:hypothetical protein
MDPNVNYNRQLEIAREIRELECRKGTSRQIVELASELAELVVDLARWIETGGFVPKPFERSES